MLLTSLLATTFATAAPPATFRFARGVLSDDMVLQSAPQQAMVWGFVPLNATVTVTLGAVTLNAKIGPDQAHDLDSTVPAMNTFRVLLPATPASFDKHNISATYSFGKPVATIYLANVMFGDVWGTCGAASALRVAWRARATPLTRVHPHVLSLFSSDLSTTITQSALGSRTCSIRLPVPRIAGTQRT